MSLVTGQMLGNEAVLHLISSRCRCLSESPSEKSACMSVCLSLSPFPQTEFYFGFQQSLSLENAANDVCIESVTLSCPRGHFSKMREEEEDDDGG